MTLLALRNISYFTFLIDRLFYDEDLEDVIVNELHFAREAARELEELTRYVDWKRNEEEEGEKESGEEKIFKRWLRTLAFFLEHCQLWHEEIVELICGTVKVFRAAKENNRDLCDQCVSLFEAAADGKDMSVDGLLKDGTIDLVLEEIQQSTLDYKMTIDFFLFFMNTSRKLKEEEEDELEEAKRKKVKRKVFEKMEERGYEDCIASFYEMFYFLNRNYYC